MLIKLHNNLQNPQVIQATRITVEDNFGNTLLAAFEPTENGYIYSMLGAADFKEVLAQLGIRKTTIVHEVTPKPLSDVIWTP